MKVTLGMLVFLSFAVRGEASPAGVVGVMPTVTWGMTFDIKVLDGQFAEHDWDEDSAPDFKVIIAISGSQYETSKVQDSYNPVWNSAARVVISGPTQVTFTLVDVDAVDDDIVGYSTVDLTLEKLTAMQTQPRSLVLYDGNGFRQGQIRVQIIGVPGTSPAELAAARQIRQEQIVGLLAGKTVTMTSGVVWTFEASEPRQVTIVAQSNDGTSATLTFDLVTSGVDGSQRASGRLWAHFTWTSAGWAIDDLRSVSFNYVQ